MMMHRYHYYCCEQELVVRFVGSRCTYDAVRGTARPTTTPPRCSAGRPLVRRAKRRDRKLLAQHRLWRNNLTAARIRGGADSSCVSCRLLVGHVAGKDAQAKVVGHTRLPAQCSRCEPLRRARPRASRPWVGTATARGRHRVRVLRHTVHAREPVIGADAPADGLRVSLPCQSDVPPNLPEHPLKVRISVPPPRAAALCVAPRRVAIDTDGAAPLLSQLLLGALRHCHAHAPQAGRHRVSQRHLLLPRLSANRRHCRKPPYHSLGVIPVQLQSRVGVQQRFPVSLLRRRRGRFLGGAGKRQG